MHLIVPSPTQGVSNPVGDDALRVAEVASAIAFGFQLDLVLQLVGINPLPLKFAW